MLNWRLKKKQIEEPIKLAILHDYFAEQEFVVSEIEKKNKAGTSLSEMVVIGRNNKDLREMADVLNRHGIAYSINADANVLNDIYILKLITIFRAIAFPGRELDLLKAMHVDFFGVEPVDVYKLIEGARKAEVSTYDFLNGLTEKKVKELKLETFKSLQLFNKKLREWQRHSQNTPFETFFIEVVNDSGFKQHLLLSSRRYELLDKLIALYEEIKILNQRKPDFSLVDFINYLDLLHKHDVALKTRVKTVMNDAVNLMTAHGSKGLEFDYVFIINAFDGHWGNARKRNRGFKIPWDLLGIKLNLEAEENEDERRLFYVALTRAKKDIVISYSTASIDGKEQIPSQFITEINEELIEEVDTKKFEDEFFKNKDQVFEISKRKELEAKDKTYFQQLFVKRGLSATALDNYLTCPWRFFYRNLLSFPDVKNKNQIYGTLMHSVMARVINSKSEARNPKEITNYKLQIIKNFGEQVRRSPLLEIEKKRVD